MPHLFTAGWIDDFADVCSLAANTFDAWISMKSQDSHSLLDVCRRTSDDPQPVCFRASLTETVPGGRRQRTEVAATSYLDPREDHPQGWITVDVHCSGDEEYGYLPSPWLVQELIRSGARPRFADDDLTISPRVLLGRDDGETLAELVTDFHRHIPLVVLSDAPDLFARLQRQPRTFAEIAAETARCCAGLAGVVLADQACVTEYNAAVGPSHAIGAGSLRLFRAGADPAVSADARRHPQWASQSWLHEPGAAPEFVGRLLAADAVTAARIAVSGIVSSNSTGRRSRSANSRQHED